MNPVDHPMGGGEGKTSGGGHPVSPWGQKAKGLKTENIKNNLINLLLKDEINRKYIMPRSVKKGPYVDDKLAEN